MSFLTPDIVDFEIVKSSCHNCFAIVCAVQFSCGYVVIRVGIFLHRMLWTVDLYNVLGELGELIDEPLSVHFVEDAAGVVIPETHKIVHIIKHTVLQKQWLFWMNTMKQIIWCFRWKIVWNISYVSCFWARNIFFSL